MIALTREASVFFFEVAPNLLGKQVFLCRIDKEQFSFGNRNHLEAYILVIDIITSRIRSSQIINASVEDANQDYYDSND